MKEIFKQFLAFWIWTCLLLPALLEAMMLLMASCMVLHVLENSGEGVTQLHEFYQKLLIRSWKSAQSAYNKSPSIDKVYFLLPFSSNRMDGPGPGWRPYLDLTDRISLFSTL